MVAPRKRESNEVNSTQRKTTVLFYLLFSITKEKFALNFQFVGLYFISHTKKTESAYAIEDDTYPFENDSYRLKAFFYFFTFFE